MNIFIAYQVNSQKVFAYHQQVKFNYIIYIYINKIDVFSVRINWVRNDWCATFNSTTGVSCSRGHLATDEELRRGTVVDVVS